jgi:hypothetical protein
MICGEALTTDHAVMTAVGATKSYGVASSSVGPALGFSLGFAISLFSLNDFPTTGHIH